MFGADSGCDWVEPDRKNPGKKPIVERTISELLHKLKRLQLSGGPLSDSTFATATANVNARSTGLSAFGMRSGRDQYTSQQLPERDRD